MPKPKPIMPQAEISPGTKSCTDVALKLLSEVRLLASPMKRQCALSEALMPTCVTRPPFVPAMNAVGLICMGLRVHLRHKPI
jgi:hypothetical protein